MRRVMLVLSVDANQVNRGFRSASTSARHFERDIARTGRGVVGATIGFKGLGRSLAMASGAFIGAATVTAGIKSAVTSATDYEASLHKITALTGVAASETAKFNEELLRMGPAVGKAPKELSDALYFITSAGFRGAAALKVLRTSAEASAAGLGDTKVVADAVTSALNAYGKGNLNASQATDVLIGAVKEGKVQADALAPVLGNVLPVAAKMGASFADVGAAMAAMTRSGFDAATASTNLTAVFSTLLKDTPKTEKGLKAVGLSAAGLRDEIKSRGLLAAFQTLQMAFKGNASAMAQAFPNIRALRTVLSLTGTSAKQTAIIFQALRASGGSLARAFKIAQADPAFRFEKLKAGIDSVKIRLGAALLPTILHVTDKMGAWLSKTQNQKKLSEGLATVIKTVTSTIGKLITKLTAVVHALGGWKKAIAIAVGAWAGFKLAGIAAAVQVQIANLVAAGVVSSAWKAALISTGFGALAVAAGIAAAYIITHWKQVKGWFGTFWKYFKDTANAAYQAVKQTGKAFVYTILQYATAGIRGILMVASKIPFVGGAAKRALNKINDYLSTWKPDFGNVTAAFANAGTRAGNAWAANVVGALTRAQAGFVYAIPLTPSGINRRDARRAPNRGPIPAGQRSIVAPSRTGSGAGTGTGAGGTGSGSYGAATAPGAPTTGTTHKGGIPAWKKEMNRAIEEFGIALKKAGWTKTLKDDESVLGRIVAYLKHQLALHKGDVDVQKDLVKYQTQLRDLGKKQSDALKQQIDNMKQQIGDLFQGPVLAPTDAQTKAKLGVLGPDPSTLLKDLQGQVTVERNFIKALLALRKRGAPTGLLTELRDLGPDATMQIKALAGAPKKLLKQYFAAFAARNKEAIQAANVNLTARNVVIKTGRTTHGATGLRHMAGGGVVTGPTRALIGEAGPEAVIPLSRMGGGGNIVIPVYLDGKMVAQSTISRGQRLNRSVAQQSRGRYPGYSLYGIG